MPEVSVIIPIYNTANFNMGDTPPLRCGSHSMRRTNASSTGSLMSVSLLMKKEIISSGGFQAGIVAAGKSVVDVPHHFDGRKGGGVVRCGAA